MIRVNLIGQIFERLTVRSYSHKSKWGHSYWVCECSCGNKAIVSSTCLKRGNTRSCGCLRKEVVAEERSTHGDGRAGKRKRLYKIWMGMRCRCNNPNAKDYELYGKRGITVCQLWEKYENFREWALTHGYTDYLSLDRINPNLGYSPDNCRWATNLEQGLTKRNNLHITAFGKTLTAVEWGRLLGIRAPTIRLRLHRGDSPEEVLSKVNKKTGKPIAIV